ncbi:MAG: tRNA lysidine(34) synthetase TilS, partial [Gammaproteobacteria bacterium]|nr:tRNA lysidine(34) synthetase TilS [Gammaproteobacteria bacterium]
RWCVALSGGLDSTVLLHGLQQLAREFDYVSLRAVHVHHGLHTDADDWTARCRSLCRDLDVPLEVRRVDVDLDSGQGTEAAARRARYAAFESLLDEGELLLTAHHAQDQVETVLLRLLRGAGVKGLGAIAVRSRFGRGWLVRPLLSLGRPELEACARDHALRWIEDPTNRDTDLDRNYLRHDVIPALRLRWPGMDASIGRTARLAAEAQELLHALAAQDALTVMNGKLIALRRLRELDGSRQRNLLRYVLQQRDIAPPSELQISGGLEQLLTAREDRNPVLRWPGGQVRRYRDNLYVLEDDPEQLADAGPDTIQWDGHEPLALGAIRGRLTIERLAGEPSGLNVRFRRGGERLLEADHAHHQRLKKMFQARGVVPWMRAHVPLLFQDEELLAVGDLWLSSEFATRLGEGARIRWEGHADPF